MMLQPSTHSSANRINTFGLVPARSALTVPSAEATSDATATDRNTTKDMELLAAQRLL